MFYKKCALALGVILLCGATTGPTTKAGGREAPGVASVDARRLHAQFDLNTWQTTKDYPYARYTLTRTSELFPQATIGRRGSVAPLERALRADLADIVADTELGKLALRDFLARSETDGFIVLHRGRVVLEEYPHMRATDHHLMWSVSKTFASLAVAQLTAAGRIDVDRPIDTYIQGLAGTAWSGTRVLDILDMTSGIDALEEDEHDTWLRPELAVFRYESSLGLLPRTPSTDIPTYDLVASFKRLRPSGERYEYVSVDTFVLGWLVEAVSGKPYAEWVAEHIWSAVGAEADAAIVVSPRSGAAAAHGGMTATLRDVARYGLIYTPSWMTVASAPVVPEGYVRRIQSGARPLLVAAAAAGSKAVNIGSGAETQQWDAVWSDGDFFKGGFRGQGLYVSPSRDLVIAFFSTQSQDQWRYARAIATHAQFDTR